jgi:hypothetical protein
LRIDDKNRKLIMERKFDVARRIVGSPEYYLLQMAKQDHPTYDVVLKHIKKNPEKQVYKKLTYAYMYEYISRHPNAEERKAELDEMILRAKCHLEKYANVKKWFLAAYPDIDDFTPAQFTEEHQKENNIDNFEVIEEARSLPLAS